MVKSDRIGPIFSNRRERLTNVNDRGNRTQDMNISDSNSIKIDYICPLCMEEMDETDKKFFPCKCRYQVCLWCFYHVRDQLDNKCPACRQLYDDSLTNRSYNRENDNLDKGEGFNWCGNAISKVRENKADNQDKNYKSEDNNNNKTCSLEDMRIIQRNLVYVVGLSYSIAKREILSCDDSFGKYGKILNMRILPNDNDTCSAFITYYDELSATKAIKNINGKKLFGQNIIRCSFGTNKYCNSFIKNSVCNNPNCAYVHEIVDSNDCISKSELINFHSSNKFALKPLRELKLIARNENENTRDRKIYKNRNKRNNNYFKTDFNNNSSNSDGLNSVNLNNNNSNVTVKSDDLNRNNSGDYNNIDNSNYRNILNMNSSNQYQNNNTNNLNNYNIDSSHISNKEKPIYDHIQNKTKFNVSINNHSTLSNSNLSHIDKELINNIHKNNHLLDLNKINERNEYNHISDDDSLLGKELELDIKNDIEKVIDEIPHIVENNTCEYFDSTENEQPYTRSLYNNSLNQNCVPNNIKTLSDVEIGFIQSLQNRELRQQINVNNSRLGNGINILRAIMPHANITIQGQ